MTRDAPDVAGRGFRTMRRLTLSNVIALIALIVAALPLSELISRWLNEAAIEIIPPVTISFRTQDVLRKMDSKGMPISRPRDSSPIIRAETKHLPMYPILPLSYRNSGDSGEGFVIRKELLTVKIGGRSQEFVSKYTTAIVPRLQSSWIGDTSPRLPTFLEGGEARSDEVVFVPPPTIKRGSLNSELTWDSFIGALQEHRGEALQISLALETLSGKIFQSASCQVAADGLLEQLESVNEDQARYYYVIGECR